ncbi:MAG TPA: DUF3341 domain-containing protein [Cytophagales bacterium]|nr:DUF3341 domain-containing protein [Cytophagales bacterium]
MSKKLIYGVFDDPDKTVAAGYKVTGAGIKVNTVYSPFPVHGIDDAIQLPRTRISTAAFMFGLTGTSLAALMTWYMLIYDWPMNIGGKPSFSFAENFPSFVPVLFECTVLLGAHGMIATFFFLNRLAPGLSPRNPDKRSTDDKFIMEIEPAKQRISESEIKALLKEAGAIEINEN